MSRRPIQLKQWMCGGIWLGLSLSLPSFASTFYQQPFPTTVEEAPLILKGKIGTHYSDWGKGINSQKIFTYYAFQNDETLKGPTLSSTNSSLLVREIGGEKDGVGLHVEGAAHFETGETVVVMVNPLNSEGTLDVHGMMLGKLTIEKDANGDEILKGPALWGSSSTFSLNQTPRPWTLSDLKRLIRQQASATPPAENSKLSQKVAPQPTPSIQPSQPSNSILPQANPISQPPTLPLPLVIMIFGILGISILLWKFLK